MIEIVGDVNFYKNMGVSCIEWVLFILVIKFVF